MGNPAGFKADKAMSFGAVSVKIDMDSVAKDVIVIKEVVISGPDITYEYADGKVAISAGLLAGKEITVPLPTIHLKDIGKKEKSATSGEVASQVMSSISG